ncbi:hypothetical protein RRF57_004770 [Xylaria bambusicola]|uniref:Uncharacterized protein n=1 Tax=Xylaria bambusicola TaxID=326684 RepID=A0AAN7UAV4_9PEZI
MLAATFASSSVRAGCYGGEGWGAGRGLAEQAVDALCDPTKLLSFVHDQFQQSQTKADYVQLLGNKKTYFSINWGGSGAISLNQGDCIQRLKDEVNGCDSGGLTTTADWTFT